jgi:hypothetical protein
VNVPAVVGVPVIVSVVELAVDVSASPVGSVPEVDHVAAVCTVIAPELYAVPTVGTANATGAMPVTVREYNVLSLPLVTVKLYVPSVVGVPVSVSVVELAVDANATPVGSVPVVDHVAALDDVKGGELDKVPTAAFGSVGGVMAAAEAGVDSPSVIPTTSSADAIPTVTADENNDLIDWRTLAILVKLLIKIPSLICSMTCSIGTCPHFMLTTGNRVSKRRKYYEWVTTNYPLTKDIRRSPAIMKESI